MSSQVVDEVQDNCYIHNQYTDSKNGQPLKDFIDFERKQ